MCLQILCHIEGEKTIFVFIYVRQQQSVVLLVFHHHSEGLRHVRNFSYQSS